MAWIFSFFKLQIPKSLVYFQKGKRGEFQVYLAPTEILPSFSVQGLPATVASEVHFPLFHSVHLLYLVHKQSPTMQNIPKSLLSYIKTTKHVTRFVSDIITANIKACSSHLDLF